MTICTKLVGQPHDTDSNPEYTKLQKFGGECRNPAKLDGDQREPARPNYFYEYYIEETAKNRYERRKYKILSKIP